MEGTIRTQYCNKKVNVHARLFVSLNEFFTQQSHKNTYRQDNYVAATHFEASSSRNAARTVDFINY